VSTVTGTRIRTPDGRTTSSGSAALGAVISTNVIGAGAFGCAATRGRRRDGRRSPRFSDPRCQLHHESERALMPTSAAYSLAVSPLFFHRSTCFAHASRDVCSIAASGAEHYATRRRTSGTRLVERL
jgi:hypothetical protein